MKDKWVALIWLGSCITILEAVALYMGIDGQLFSTTIASIVGLFGYALGKKDENKIPNRNK